MRLKQVLLASVVALSFSFTTPAPAKADPVTAAIVTAVVGTGASATVVAIATFVVNSALYTAASMAIGKITGALSGKNKQSIQDRQASVTTLSLGEVPREAVIGMTAVGGSLVDVWNWGGQYGTDNVTRCIALADHACEALFGYYVDDVFYTFAGNGVQPGFNGTLTIEYRNAAAAGHAPPSYASAAGWETGDRMTAVTHVWVTTRFDEKVWTQGHPKFRWVLHGLQAFDPRNGDVWADRSTHSFTRNPTLLRYALARGIYAEGRQGQAAHLLIGRGLSAEEAPPERLIAPANLCDELIDGLFRYYTDGVISADMDFVTVEQMFADAMAGSIIQHEGGVEVEPGQAKAVVATITDADLVVGEPVTYSEFLPDNDGGRINSVVPRYPDPGQAYADHSGPVRRDLADLIKDGGPRETTLSLPIVTGGAVADRNAEITRRLARLERRASIVLPAWFGWLEEGDWIAWQSDRRHAGATRRYRIEGWTLGKDWRMRLSLREIASSVYGVPDPVEDTAETPPPPPVIDALSLPGAAVQAITLAGEMSVIPAIRATWDTPVDAAVRAIRLEVRTAGDTDASPTRFEGDQLAQGVGIGTNGVGADQVLQARLVPVGDPSRPVLPSVWFTVNTAPVTARDAATLGGTPAAELLGFFRELPRVIVDTDQAAETLIQEALDRHGQLVAERKARILDVLDEETARIAAILSEEAARVAGLLAEQAARVAGLLAEAAARGAAIAGVNSSVTTLATNLAAEIVTRTEQYAATVSSVALVDGRVTTVAGLLSAETETRQTQISAVNASVAGVDSRVTTSATDLANLSLSVTVQFSSMNGSLSEVIVLANTVSTGLATETATRQAQFSSLGLSISGVDARITTAATDLVALTNSTTIQFSAFGASLSEVIVLANTVSTGLATETETRITQTSALGISISVVDGRVTTVATALASETETRTTQTSALGASIAMVDGRVTTTATELSALTSSVSIQLSGINGNLSAVITLANTTATLNSALTETVTALSASTATSLANVGTQLTALSNADTVLSTAITTAQTTANGASSSATFVLSALNGNQAYAALMTDVNGRFTGMRINGATQAVDFLAEYFNVTAGAGGGISYSAPSKLFKIFDGTSKTVLKAGGNIRMWSGPSSVADGDETEENGVLAVGPGVTGGGRFNGVTLSGPFGAEAPSGSSTALTASFATVGQGERVAVNGAFFFEVSAAVYPEGTPNGEGFRTWSVDLQIVSSAWTGGDAEVVWTDSFGGSWGPGAPVEWVNYLGRINLDAPGMGTRSGRRRLSLQARTTPGSTTTSAALKDGYFRGFYAA